MVPGSIPGAGATNTQILYLSVLQQLTTDKLSLFTTILQHYDDTMKYLNNDISYLQMISKTYYFVLRVKKKIIKKSLKTSNLKTANIKKIKIMDNLMKDSELPEYLKNFTKPPKDMIKVITIIEDGDDIEEAEKIKNSINKTLNNKVSKSEKIDKLTTETVYENTISTLEDELKNFYKHYEKTNNRTENFEDRFLEFKTSFEKYLFLKFPKDTKIYTMLDYEDWDNFRDFIISLPNNTIRRYGTKRWGTDIDYIVDTIITEYEEKNEEPVLMNSRSINKHFNIFSIFLDYLELTQKITKNPIKGMTPLKEYPNPYLNYTDEDLQKLFQIEDEEVKNFFKVGLYTGLRLSAIISINKNDIEYKYGKPFKLKVLKDKTTNGQRTITIHNQLLDIFNDYVNSNRDYLFFDTNKKDPVQKYINPLIFKTIGTKKTIHGFRKNFTIELYNSTYNDNYRKYIVGHSQKSDITFTVYNLENIDFIFMNNIINDISYPSIEIQQKQTQMDENISLFM
ncbi:MAG: tyrosine-type recombinase/integrase [Patescibacteria group bacterium]|nr:tyrosine-type recombinase/integrase [Patescibacteria group bacterium]